MSVNIEKFLKYLNIQKSLRSKDFTEHCICIKEYFDMFFCTEKYIPQAQNSVNHWISIMIICLKNILEEHISFNGYIKIINVTIKFLLEVSPHKKTKLNLYKNKNLYSQFQKIFKSVLWLCFKTNPSNFSLRILFIYLKDLFIDMHRASFDPIKSYQIFGHAKRIWKHSQRTPTSKQSEGAPVLGHSEGTRTLGGHSNTYGTWTLEHIGHSGTWALRALTHLFTRARGT